jgi:hypothetical protein
MLGLAGAPVEHFPVPAGRRGAGEAEPPAEETWPYMVRLTNTKIDPAFIR